VLFYARDDSSVSNWRPLPPKTVQARLAVLEKLLVCSPRDQDAYVRLIRDRRYEEALAMERELDPVALRSPPGLLELQTAAEGGGVDVLEGSLSLRVHRLSAGSADKVRKLLDDAGQLVGAAFAPALEAGTPQLCPLLVEVCNSLVPEIPAKLEKETKKAWTEVRGEDVIPFFWQLDIRPEHPHYEAQLLYHALAAFVVQTTGKGLLARVFFFDDRDKLSLDDLVRRYIPPGHASAMPVIAAAATSAGFTPRATKNEFDPPSLPGETIALFAWSPAHLADGKRIIRSYVSRRFPKAKLIAL
jgi:hypothetical protein